MSNITPPSQPASPLYVSKGARGANGNTFYVYGYTIPNNANSDFTAANLSVPYSPIDPTTLFDLSATTENHEVPMVIFSPTGLNVTSSVNVSFYWRRKRDGLLIYVTDLSIAPPASGGWSSLSAAAWIGWLSDGNNGVGTYPQYREIQENGDYYCNVTASGGYSFNSSADFAISGIPAKTVLENIQVSGFDWTTRLTNYFDSSNYIQSGVCTQPFTDGQTSPPNGILASASSPSSNSGCAVTGTVSNLSTGNYTIYGFVQAANGLYYNIGSGVGFTSTAGIPTEVPTVSAGMSNNRYVSLSWTATSNTTGYKVYKNSGSGDYLVGSYSTTSVQFQLDYEYTNYTFRVVPYNSYGDGAVGGTASARSSDDTYPITDSFYSTQITANQITMYAKAHDPLPTVGGNASGVKSIEFYLNGTWQASQSVNANGEAYYTYTGLVVNTTYTLEVRVFDNQGLLSPSVTASVTTSNSRPADWFWAEAKVQGQPIPNYNGKPAPCSAADWNGFTAKVNSFRVYYDYKFGTSLGNYSFSTAIAGSSSPLAHIDEARNAISAMNPPTSVPAQPSTVSAFIYNQLRDSLNSIA